MVGSQSPSVFRKQKETPTDFSVRVWLRLRGGLVLNLGHGLDDFLVGFVRAVRPFPFALALVPDMDPSVDRSIFGIVLADLILDTENDEVFGSALHG